ncbi:MAG TPA: zf-HC2 domain-containing protein [Gemmatimonadaceae bacterium]|nr:zf-HC2 domain-containing protein [Gemmatimonadaceae bacterium]
MDCREFRDKHSAFVDDVLPGVDMDAMQRHLAACPPCARHDTTIRRALLLFRNLPEIRPSGDFTERLNARLRAVRTAGATTVQPGPGVGAFVGAASLVVALGYLAAVAAEVREPRDVVLPPVVATMPGPAAISDPVLLASASIGMPVWPTAYLAEPAGHALFRLVAAPVRRDGAADSVR